MTELPQDVETAPQAVEPEEVARAPLPGPPPDDEHARYALAGRTIAALGLDDSQGGLAHLAESALWLALLNQGDALRDDLEALLDGAAWDPLFGGAAPRVVRPDLNRAALGLLLQRRAGAPDAGAAERTLAALAALCLACVDPDTGRRLQRGFGRLKLLDVVEQIPTALPTRMLALEFRHMGLADAPIPPAFVARLEDVFERLDALGLLRVRLSDLPGAVTDTADGLLEALLITCAPSQRTLARVLFQATAPHEDPQTLLAACASASPAVWSSEEHPSAMLERAYASLVAALADTPFALSPPGRGRYGLARPAS